MLGMGKFANTALEPGLLISPREGNGGRAASSALGFPRATLHIHLQVALKGAQVSRKMEAGILLTLHSPSCVP